MSVTSPTQAPPQHQPSALPPGLSCPRCQEVFAHSAEECPSCQFSLATARRAFPFAAPPLDFLVDPTNVLPEDAAPALEATYVTLREKFPQVGITLSLLNLAPGTPLREFAFWWFNDAPEGNVERHWHLLLLFDAQTGELSLTPGYALERHLLSSPLSTAWKMALETTAATAAESGWATAFNSFLQNAQALLEANWQNELKSQSDNPVAS